ncbi:MAG: FRG domain-containing protein [Nitrospirota bacterium]
MAHRWPTTNLNSEVDVLQVCAELRGKRWLCRGQSKCYGSLIPSIDHEPRHTLSRSEKLSLERQSIDVFRSTAKFFAHPGEQGALTDDFIALMVLRHYGVPTRLLDWTMSPYVAAYFAACSRDTEDGEIWSFDEPFYEQEGKKQWVRWPETTTDGTGGDSKFAAGLTAFTLHEPPDWFICAFYPGGFPRQLAQVGAYTTTARFGQDHTIAIANLLSDPARYHLYIISARLKQKLRTNLRESHGIWRGSLFPDSAGAAATAATGFEQ